MDAMVRSNIAINYNEIQMVIIAFTFTHKSIKNENN